MTPAGPGMIPDIIQKRGAVYLAAAEPAGFAADIPPDVLALVPASVARENAVLPFKLAGDKLYVYAVDPHDIGLADKLTFTLNKRVVLVRADRRELLAAIDRHYGQTGTESVDSFLMAAARPLPPAMARASASSPLRRRSAFISTA